MVKSNSEYQSLYRIKNIDKINRKLKLWRIKNPDYDKNRRELIKLDPELSEKRRVYNKNYERLKKLKDPQFALKKSLRNSLARNIRRYLSGKKDDSALNLIGCTIEEFSKFIEQKFEPNMQWLPKRNFHLDHIKPCASFDLTDPEQVKQCFHYTNYQPLWPSENMSKNDKLEWSKSPKNALDNS